MMASKTAKKKRYPLIPEGERKCVWMMTGLISYKLCDRDYRCEFCPFDQALKNQETGGDDVLEPGDDWMEGSLKDGPSTRINASAFYHPDHYWVKVEDPENVRMGIDDLLAQLITNIKVVILPQVGSAVGRGECCCHIIQDDYILPVVSPLSGSIQAVNLRLQKEPSLVTEDPRGGGWLIMMKPNDLESDLKKLLFGRKALAWYQREEKEILARTDLILRRNPPDVGPTMQDGGVRIGSLKDILNAATAKQRAQILDLSVARQQRRN